MHFSIFLSYNLNTNIFSIFPQTQMNILYRLLPADFTYEKLSVDQNKSNRNKQRWSLTWFWYM